MRGSDIAGLTGLSDSEAVQALKKYGFNELPAASKRGIFKLIFEVVCEPMFILLLSCGIIYFILGDVHEALMLLGFVFVVMGITIYQEGKAERAIDALRSFSSPRALVIRSGRQQRIPGREVVCGDTLILREGDRVPADCFLLWGENVLCDESLLTGESAAVRKAPSILTNPDKILPGGDDLPLLFSGSLLVRGQAVVKVLFTGINTRLGKIGKALVEIEDEASPLREEIKKVVKLVFVIASIICVLVVIVYGLTRDNWLGGVLSGITLAMAMLPEEFPVVLTIFMALGAWRISKSRVLTRKIASIETLGSAQVLCVDKTGTLTENRMSVKKLFCQGEFFDITTTAQMLPEKFHQLVEFGILASKKDPFDPMEKALQELGHFVLRGTEHLHLDWGLVQEYPLSREIMALSHVWECGGDGLVVSAKGAPEAIGDLCHLDLPRRNELQKNIDILAKDGLRVLGVARSTVRSDSLPQSQHDFNFEFMGLVGWADPVRPSVREAIAECYDAGIRVIMITGDYPVTAVNIAGQIGLKNYGQVITGQEILVMPEKVLEEKMKEVNVFSRVLPDQKLLIVNAIKAGGKVVAMTGDGVNDASALKSAHIGIAMGERGTDVAREAADLVLLDDDFSSIVKAIRLGRRIFDNLKKAIAYIISVHVPIAGAALVPVFMGWPIILYPAHIVFLELVIDPACSLVFEAESEEPGIMHRPPRPARSRLFTPRLIGLSIFQGLFSMVAALAIFKVSLMRSDTVETARTLSFGTLIISNICLILTNRSWHKSILETFRNTNRALFFVISGAVVALVLTIYVPFLRKLFHFSWMHNDDILIFVAAGFLSVAWFELIKFFARRANFELMS